MIVQHELYGAQFHQLSNTTVRKGGVKEAVESAERLLAMLAKHFPGQNWKGTYVYIIQYVLASLPVVSRATKLQTSLLL